MSDFPPCLRTPGLLDEARRTLDAGVLGPAPLQLIDTVAARYGEARPDVLHALALVVEAQGRGHTALDLNQIEGALAPREAEDEAFAWPSATALDEWEARVAASSLVGDESQVDRPFELIEAGGRRLFVSRRMAADQRRLVASVKRLAAATPDPPVDPNRVEVALARLFLKESDGEGARATRLAADGALTVVTGGPGTGKTWSIKRLLALLLEERLDLRIVLAAPTGKAAVRMTEAMGEELEGLRTTEAVRARLRSLPASTVHKLLRVRPDSGATRYGLDKPLTADVVVVDEASMLDVQLMRKLVEAIGEGTRLILLGDKDQLASVEAGTVLADLVAAASEGGALAGRVAYFTVNHRSKDAPTVAAAARAVQEASPASLARAVDYFVGEATAEGETEPKRLRQLHPVPQRGRPAPAVLDDLAAPYLQKDGPTGYAEELARVLATEGPSGAWPRAAHLLDALGRYRVLATHRRGPLGVSGLERELSVRVRRHLRAALAAYRGESERPLPRRGGLWLGQPVLVTENAYDVDLRNGDVGLVLPVPGKGLEVVFPVVHGGERSVRALPIARLPSHRGALAMTVHKSQGSQFDEVGLVLAGRASPIQTRELIYTGLTRAKSRVRWVGSADELAASLARPVGRISAMSALL